MLLFFKAFLFITGLFMLSLYMKSLLRLALDAIIMPLFGLELKSVNIFGLHFERSRREGWHRVPFRRTQFISHLCGVNLDKPIPEDIDKREKTASFLSVIILLAISVAVLILTWGSVERLVLQKSSILDSLIAGFSLGLVWHALFSVGSVIYIYMVMMKKLAGYTNSLVKRIRAGEKISEMNLRPVAELPYENPNKIEIMLYNSIYLHINGRINEMSPVIAEMTEYFRNREFNSAEMMNYMWLIFWYSRYDLQPQTARVFYDRVSSVLLTDHEANSKRVLGYYAFGIERDVFKARQYVTEGLAVVDDFSLPGEEREMERRLLLELQGFIDKECNVPQGTKL